MSRICFVSYEIHPTTWGGAGVLLRNAAERLLADGHEIVFLLDVPERYFYRFDNVERLKLPNPTRCRSYHVESLSHDFAISAEDVDNIFLWKALRFDHALDKVLHREKIDFVEFFEYCGVAYYALVSKLFNRKHTDTILGVRAHNSVELIDAHESTKPLDRARYLLYALEKASLAWSEVVLFPSFRYAEVYYRRRYGIDERAIVVSEPPTRLLGRRSRVPSVRRNEIVYYGRVFQFKGLESFVRAALMFVRRQPDSHVNFRLIGPDSHDSPGGGSYIQYLRSLIPEQYEERFVFTGHLDHPAVLERLDSALFAVFPNHFESFCYALHEVYDAGVPVIVADIPAFRDYFRNGENALVFDNTTEGLLIAMQRMYDDAELRDRLTGQVPMTRDPLGMFYHEPRARIPLRSQAECATRVLTVVLVPDDAPPEAEQVTLKAVQKGTNRGDHVVVVRDAVARGGSSDAPVFTWLGRPRRMETSEGRPLLPDEERTLDAIWILLAGDVPDPAYLPMCRGALAISEGRLGFAGCWARDSEGHVRAATFDIAPEIYPFLEGARRTRAVIRTDPGQLLAEIFDLRIGSYGEIAYLWKAERRWGRGCLLAEPLLEMSGLDRIELQAEHLAFLVAATEDEERRRRLAGFAVALDTEFREAVREPQTTPSCERRLSYQQARQIAWQILNGRTLAHMAYQKLNRKARSALLPRCARIPFGRRASTHEGRR